MAVRYLRDHALDVRRWNGCRGYSLEASKLSSCLHQPIGDSLRSAQRTA